MANPFTPEQISQILEEFFKVVGTRQYIGARYVPIFGRKDEESIEWDNSEPYEPLTIVLYQGNSYTSRQYVPVGVEITNQEFWANTGNYNAQVEQYRRDTAAAMAAANAAQTDIDTLLPKSAFNAQDTVKALIDAAQAAANAAQTDIDTLLPKSAFNAENTVKALIDAAQAAANAAQTTANNVDYMTRRTIPLSKVLTPTKIFEDMSPSGLYVQGMTTDGTNLYCAFASGGQLKIIEYDTSGNKISESPTLLGGHGNSLTYHDGYIYAPILFAPAGTSYNNRQIAKINPTTWEISVFTVNAPCDSAYVNSDMCIYTSYPNQQLFIDTSKGGVFSPFTKVQLLKTPSPIQDIDYINNLLFICHGITLHNPYNYINVYSLFGTFMGSLAIDLYNVELEGIAQIGSTTYISVRDGVTNNLVVYTIDISNLFSTYGVDSFSLTRTWPDVAHLFVHKTNLFTSLDDHPNFVTEIKFNPTEVAALKGEFSNAIQGRFLVGYAELPCYFDRASNGIVVTGEYLNAGTRAKYTVFARYVFSADNTSATLTTFYSLKHKDGTTTIVGNYTRYLEDADINDSFMPIFIDCVAISGVYASNGYQV